MDGWVYGEWMMGLWMGWSIGGLMDGGWMG